MVEGITPNIPKNVSFSRTTASTQVLKTAGNITFEKNKSFDDATTLSESKLAKNFFEIGKQPGSKIDSTA